MKLRYLPPVILSSCALVATSFAGASAANLPTPANQHPTTTQVSEDTDRIIVKFKDEQPKEVREEVANKVEAESDAVDDSQLLKETTAADEKSSVISADKMLNPDEQKEVIANLEKDPRVESAEPDRLVKALASTSEPYYSKQWALTYDYLDVAPAWSKYTGVGQTIGIVDTGYSVHPDLETSGSYGYDFISSPSLSRDGGGRDTNPLDQGSDNPSVDWHGTFVAGIAAARANGTGTTGVAPSAQLTYGRALGLNGSGYVSDIADALIWTSGGYVPGVPTNKRPATVVNMSLAYPDNTCSDLMQSAINDSLSRNVPVVVAAGNEGQSASNYSPANCYRAIVVGASTSWYTLTEYSNYGEMLDVVAPGGTTGRDIFGPLNTGSSSIGSPTYGTMNGTSMAAPYVTGTIALMKQAYPAITVEQIRNILTSTGYNLQGYKQVDAAAAVKAAADLAPVPASQFTLKGAIGDYYKSKGGITKFGSPTTNEFSGVNGGAIQAFAKNYSIYWTSRTDAHSVNFAGSIGARYRDSDYERGLGYPAFDEVSIPGGAMQKFAPASGPLNALYWTSQNGTHLVAERGAIGSRFTNEGGTGKYGFPVEDEGGIGSGGARQVFQNGSRQNRFYWAPNTGAYLVNGNGAIKALWESRGGVNTDGFPVTDEIPTAGGAVQYFRNANWAETGIWWSSTTGAHAMNSKGAIYNYWWKNGYVSKFGFPVTDEVTNSDGSATVKFSNGSTLKWTANGGVRVVR
ncbi:S8 family serine peptidase [Rothia terrae]|uniref:S8 family serine peptidase n=1 Tax=Rothia terrae TaxID=396015 RepID=A0A7H2BCY9_9MICC|nr:S8 family serine peptidase [Rothia terrae]QNV37535.1 S8 family serine peptidase [Rothia terrae]